ncbi:MAG TPA: hypothetical protein VD906_12030 [Caulobacteraceae bacterium]|nr:hypothetical protein [Caulobacteraceae bacterium]
MSVDNAGQGERIETVEPAAPDETARKGRGVSLWFLVVPIALAMAAAAIAFFLLSPRDEDLMTTTNEAAVAVAVRGATPAPPAFNPTAATTPQPSEQATNSAP